MKKVSLVACCLVAALMFMAASKNTPENSLKSLEGVWELQNQFLYEDGELLDTLVNLNGYRQIKIFTKNKVMWSRYNRVDTNQWFGYGSYKITDGYLEEKLEYGSQAMMQIVDTVQVFRFELEIGKKTYSQYTLDRNGVRESAENYVRVE